MNSAFKEFLHRSIEAYIADILTEWDFSVANVTTIDPQRTFWDKIMMILHGVETAIRQKTTLDV